MIWEVRTKKLVETGVLEERGSMDYPEVTQICMGTELIDGN